MVHKGGFDMSELYSNAEDCNKIAKILYNKLKRKIEFYGSTYQEVISGKYHCLPFKTYNSYDDYKSDEVSFAYKFCENGFLRISVGDAIYKKTIGHKLAVLSDFYEVISEIYGVPTLFYIIKDDDENTINLQWSFVEKEQDIENFKNGTAFDDARIDELIVFDEPTKQNDACILNDTTKKMIAEQIGLPFELIYLLDKNIDDFIKYKHGTAMSVYDEVKIDSSIAFESINEERKAIKKQDKNAPVLIKKIK